MFKIGSNFLAEYLWAMNFKNTNLILYFITDDILNRYGGMEVYLHTFFTLLLDGGECSDSAYTPWFHKRCSKFVPSMLITLNRNKDQESSSGVKSGRRVWLTPSLPSVSRLSREFGILDLSQSLWISTACYTDSFICFLLQIAKYLSLKEISPICNDTWGE
jgi:hypothetical protein